MTLFTIAKTLCKELTCVKKRPRSVLKTFKMFLLRIVFCRKAEIHPFAYCGLPKSIRGHLIVGVFSYVGRDLHASANIVIGKYTMLANGVSIVGSDHLLGNISIPMRFTNCKFESITTIGNNVWVGHNAIIIAGVKIGDGAVVGAGSVVTKNVDKNAVVAGNPARFIKLRGDSTDIQKFDFSNYMDYY